MWRVLGWVADGNQEWYPVILNCEIVLMNPHREKSLVLVYGVPIFFVYCRLVGDCIGKHAYQRLPLISPNGISSKHYACIPAPMEQIACVKPKIKKAWLIKMFD